tara:strand:- start:36 stop:209 length:174 start_codon:yes stop_codon:yes gene_type:complete
MISENYKIKHIVTEYVKRGGPTGPLKVIREISLEEFPISLFGFMIIYFKLIDHGAVK